MSEKDSKKPEWYKRYKLLEKKKSKHKGNTEKLKSKIQELELKLGYERKIQ